MLPDPGPPHTSDDDITQICSKDFCGPHVIIIWRILSSVCPFAPLDLFPSGLVPSEPPPWTSRPLLSSMDLTTSAWPWHSLLWKEHGNQWKRWTIEVPLMESVFKEFDLGQVYVSSLRFSSSNINSLLYTGRKNQIIILRRARHIFRAHTRFSYWFHNFWYKEHVSCVNRPLRSSDRLIHRISHLSEEQISSNQPCLCSFASECTAF